MGKLVKFRNPGPWGEKSSQGINWRHWGRTLRKLTTGLAVGGLVGYAGLSFAPPLVGCKIKGNISVNTGERIYHVPGQQYYFQTVISPSKGERWFCSEAQARAAGWRRSRV